MSARVKRGQRLRSPQSKAKIDSFKAPVLVRNESIAFLLYRGIVTHVFRKRDDGWEVPQVIAKSWR